MGLIGTCFALDKADLDLRIRKLTAKFDSMQSKPDRRVPAEMLKNAKGIVLLDRIKAGFIFAYQGGGGVAMVKNKSGDWSAPVFLKSNEASLGFQIGGQQSFVVILLMNTNAVSMLTDGKFSFGGEASGTAGDASAGAEGMLTEEPLTVVYTDKAGLYGGAALKGSALSADNDANIAYYESYFSAKEILLDGKGKASEAAKELVGKLQRSTK